MVIAGLTAVTLLAWAYLLLAARGMGGTVGTDGWTISGLLMPRAQDWGSVDLLLLFAMWVIMMVAMMVPSVAPFVLMFARLRRKKADVGSVEVVGSAGILLLGYLVAWTGFSVLATLAQWALHRTALVSPMMVSASPVLGGLLLVAAGIFQLTPLKRACLVHCRSPLSFLMAHWRPGRRGAFAMGWKHGIYCVGCCWMLMTLLFVAGVMNLLWVAAITAFVLMEKALPMGRLVGRIAGAALVAAGVTLIAGGGLKI